MRYKTVLVCGSRTFSNMALAHAVLDGVTNYGSHVDSIIHGDAAGADTLAAKWGAYRGITVWAYPAQWSDHGKAAGPMRNQQMLDERKPDLVIAFTDKPIKESRGTKHMVGLAKKAGIEVLAIREYRGA